MKNQHENEQKYIPVRYLYAPKKEQAPKHEKKYLQMKNYTKLKQSYKKNENLHKKCKKKQKTKKHHDKNEGGAGRIKNRKIDVGGKKKKLRQTHSYVSRTNERKNEKEKEKKIQGSIRKKEKQPQPPDPPPPVLLPPGMFQSRTTPTTRKHRTRR